MGRKTTKIPHWVNDIFSNTGMSVLSVHLKIKEMNHLTFYWNFGLIGQAWWSLLWMNGHFDLLCFLLCWGAVSPLLYLSFYFLFPILGPFWESSKVTPLPFFCLTIALGVWFPNFELWYLELTVYSWMKPFEGTGK